jgi:hypothetical protein
MSAGWLLVVVGLAALAFALAVGGREERLFVAVQAASALGEHAAVRFGESIAMAVMIDLGVLALVIPMALRTHKAWPLFAASLCVATLMTEGAQMLVQASDTAYAIIQGAWDLLADLVVAVGAWNVWRSRRAFAALQTQTPGPG